MAGQPSTQLQASGHRYLLRRTERALLCGDPRPPHEPLRARSALAAGAALALVVAVGCALLAMVRPQPGDAPIVVGQPSAALYVRVGDALHPVLNLASARLITATDADPRPVRDAVLDRAHRGPLLGIPGAPHTLGAALPQAATWTVCDTGSGTTVIVGDPDPVGHPVDAVLATAGARTYLLHRGRRLLVDLAPLRPAGVTARRVSGVLLNAVPEGPAASFGAALKTVAVLPPDTALCVSWSGLAHGDAEITLSAGAGPPAGGAMLAQADGPGPALDAVALPPGRSAYVQAVGVDGLAAGERYLVAPTGVRFAVDDDAARSLGLPPGATPAPWPVLAALPVGPRLSRRDALLARDVVDTGCVAGAGPP